MIFTKVVTVLCGTGLVMAILADGLFLAISRALGGFGIMATPRGWVVLFGIGWTIVFIVGWQISRSLNLLPYR